jgi:hypothetical protein
MKRPSIATIEARRARRTSLFKSDYPRAIDRYIDYFGGSSCGMDDPCGEALLETLDFLDHATPGARGAACAHA